MENSRRRVLEAGGWLLIRVYCETADEGRVESLLAEGLKLAGLKE